MKTGTEYLKVQSFTACEYGPCQVLLKTRLSKKKKVSKNDIKMISENR